MLRREKGLDTLLRAFARVKDLNPEMRLLLVGSGDMLPGLESLANRSVSPLDVVLSLPPKT